MKNYFLTQTDEKTASIVNEFLRTKSLYVLRSQIRGHMGMPKMQASDKSFPYQDSQRRTSLHVAIPKRNKSKLSSSASFSSIKSSNQIYSQNSVSTSETTISESVESENFQFERQSLSPIHELDSGEFTFKNRAASPEHRRT